MTSGWLALEAGERYYVEVLHKAGVGSDNLAIGWSKPGQSTAAPSEVVPSYVLSPYVAPAPGATQGTLYISTMLAQAGAVTNGVGTATLRVSGDESVAYLRFSYSGLTGSLTSKHIHADPYLSHPAGEIIYDIDTPDTSTKPCKISPRKASASACSSSPIRITLPVASIPKSSCWRSRNGASPIRFTS